MCNEQNRQAEPAAPKLADKRDSQAKGSFQASKVDTPSTLPFIVYRSRDCLKLVRGSPPCDDQQILLASEDKSDQAESVVCSDDGQLLAWCSASKISCLRFRDLQVVFDQINSYKSNCLCISPKSTKLMTYSTTTVGDNLHFWDISTQTLLASMPIKQASAWKPVFSMNEELCVQHVSKELLFYSNGLLDKPKHRISHLKIDDFSLSTSSSYASSFQHTYDKRAKNKAHHIAIYTAGSKGQPSIIKIFKYPNMNDCVASKSFFKADRVKFNWSPSGNSLLLLCQSEFDKSGKSYYGEQSLQYMSIKADSCFVKLPKEGPISHFEWLPNCDKDVFICVYGFMPSKVSMFDHECEIIQDFQEGSFNAVAFNPFGNLLAIYGFGNLNGLLNIWSLDKKKQISSTRVPETTGIEWCADGLHYITYTTTPRLRVNNGFRLWHYSGSLVHEEVCTDSTKNLQLYDVFWQPKPNIYTKPKCDIKPQKLNNLLSQSKLQKHQKTAAKYVPPSMRGDARSAFDSAIATGADNCPIVGLGSLVAARSNNQHSKSKNKFDKSNHQSGASIDILGSKEVKNNDEPETPKERRIRNINSILGEIERLKKKQDSGEVLKPNQVVRISNESSLRRQLAMLNIQ